MATKAELCICWSLRSLYMLYYGATQIELFNHISIAAQETLQCGFALSEDPDQPDHPASLIRGFCGRRKKALTLSYPMSTQR